MGRFSIASNSILGLYKSLNNHSISVLRYSSSDTRLI